MNNLDFNNLQFNNFVSKSDKLNDATRESINSEVLELKKKISKCRDNIEKCDSIGSFDSIDISTISNEISFIYLNAMSVDEKEFKTDMEELNQEYRSLEILYFDKQINILRDAVNNTAFESEKYIKDLTTGTLFSIASVFLGISLTSALVAGLEYISSNFIILYFITCLLIAVVTIGIAAIFMRKFDDKSRVIVIIIVAVSALWGMTVYYTYENNGNNCNDQNLNEVIYQDLNNEEIFDNK